jgi:flagellar biosynthesis protein FlhG
MDDQAAKLRELMKQRTTQPKSGLIRNTRVIAVTSGKGGVGKSNITVNLGIAFARQGRQVLVMDVDLGMANVDVLLGRSAKYNFSHLLDHSCMISDIISEGPGIRYIAGGSGIQQLANLSETELLTITNQLTKLDNWADIILLDTGAGMSRNVLHFVTCADEIIVVTTPEPTALLDAYSIIKAIAQQPTDAPVRLVVNRVSDADEARGVAASLNRVCRQFLSRPLSEIGYVIEDIHVSKAVRQQHPFYLLYPHSGASECIQNLAYTLLGKENEAPAQGFSGFLQRFMERVW